MPKKIKKETPKCATCDAMSRPDFQRDLPHAIELGHIAGMVIGVALVGGHSAQDARAEAKRRLCQEHASDLFHASRYLADLVKKAENST
jgi:hypothetical protein